MVTRRTSAIRGERGAASVELVIIVPAIMLIVALLAVGWRWWSARADLASVTEAAARAAAMQRSGTRAERVASEVIDANAPLAVPCQEKEVRTDVSGFALAPGTPAQVVVRVSCRVDLSDLAPGVPGAFDIEVQARHVLDTYRERRP